MQRPWALSLLPALLGLCLGGCTSVRTFPRPYPGWSRERKIVECLMRLEGTLQEADRMPPPPPPRRPEQSCERIQGRSCGPPGAVVPCDAASGWPLQCTCKGVWDCR